MRSRFVLAAGLAFASWSSRSVGAQSKAPDIPANPFLKPAGPYAVGTHDTVFIDQKRAEILTKDPSDRRHVPVQIGYPAERTGADPRRTFGAPVFQDRRDWSPDGALIAFFRIATALPYEPSAIVVMRPDGTVVP